MIVVTGAAGFIGANLIAALHAATVPVVGIDRAEASAAPAWPTIVGDLVDPTPAVRSVLRSADVVVHLAGRAGVRDARPAATALWWRDNVSATASLLGSIGEDAHLVVASSSSVYGGRPGLRASTETDVLRPRGGYAHSKVTVERLCTSRRGPTTVVRPFTVIGEGQRPDMALSLWIDAAAHGRSIRLFGDPARSRDLTDVADVVHALVKIVERTWTGITNIGTGVAVTLGEMAAAVAEVLGDVAVHIVPADSADAAHTLASTRRLEQAIGFRPRTDLVAVVRRQAARQLGAVARPASSMRS